MALVEASLKERSGDLERLSKAEELASQCERRAVEAESRQAEVEAELTVMKSSSAGQMWGILGGREV